MKRLLPPKAALHAAAKKKTTGKKTARNRTIKWTFATVPQADLVALARLGQSNARIRQHYGFTDGEIAYATRKWQDYNQRTGGLRRAWANGQDPLVRQVIAEKLAIIRAEIQKDMPGKILHLPPETVTAAQLESGQAQNPLPQPPEPTQG